MIVSKSNLPRDESGQRRYESLGVSLLVSGLLLVVVGVVMTLAGSIQVAVIGLGLVLVIAGHLFSAPGS